MKLPVGDGKFNYENSVTPSRPDKSNRGGAGLRRRGALSYESITHEDVERRLVWQGHRDDIILAVFDNAPAMCVDY